MSIRSTAATGAPRRSTTAPDGTVAWSAFVRVRVNTKTAWGSLIALMDSIGNVIQAQEDSSGDNIVFNGTTGTGSVIAVTTGVWYDVALTYNGTSGGASSLVGYAQQTGLVTAFASASA